MVKIEFMPCNLKYLAVACKRSNSDVGALIKGLHAFFTEGKEQKYDNEGMQMLYDLFVDDLSVFLATKKKQSKTNSDNASSKKKSGKGADKKPKKGKTVANATAESVDDVADDADDGNGGNDDCDDASSDDDDAVAGDDSEPSVSIEDIKPPEVVGEKSDVKVMQGTLPFAFEANGCSYGNETCKSDANSKVANEISDRSDTERNASAVSEVHEDDVATTFAKLRDLYNKTGDNEDIAFACWQRLSANNRADALSYAESIAGKSGYRSYLYVFLRDKEWLKPGSKKH